MDTPDAIEPQAELSATPAPLALLEFETDEITCAALAVNGFPCVRQIVVTPLERIPQAKLTVEIDGYPHCTVPKRLGNLSAEVRFAVDLTEFRLPLDLLQGFTERRKVEIRARLTDIDGSVVASKTHELNIAPEAHWPGTDHGCTTIATFVTPNSPILAEILRDVSGRLARKTGSGALDGVLSGSAERIQRIAECCYEAVAELGITYVALQASFEQTGQKVRTADDVLKERIGNCLDLSVTLAAVMEAAQIHPMIVLGNSHAVVAFSTNDTHFPDPMHAGIIPVTNRLDLGEIRIVEATALCGTPQSFGQALASAETSLRVRTEMAAFGDDTLVVDIRACRLAGIHPLPQALERNRSRADAPVELPTDDYAIVQPVDLPPLPSDERDPVEKRIEDWKSKLLDLTLRNRLLNDTPRTGLPLSASGDVALQTLLAALFTDSPLFLRPEPGTPAGLIADSTGEEIQSGVLRTLLPEALLFDRATKVYRDARSSLEETGARSLYLAVGFLEFAVAGRPMPVRAPLLLVPAALERISRAEGYRVRMVADEIVPNVALLEYLRVTQNKEIGLAPELLADNKSEAIREVLDRVRQAVRDVPGMRVVAEVKLGNYLFKKLPLFEEMRQRSTELASHPVVSALLARDADPALRNAPLVEPSQVGTATRYASLRLPLPADSSQIAAVLSATGGNTFVLQGPPGTGKSQTITNLLVECLARGLRVLFVAEKSAALEVVSERLRKTGLGAFALDLHAENATKTHFVTQIKSSLEMLDGLSRMGPSEHSDIAADVDQSCDRIQRAVDALHAQRGPRLSVFTAIDRACEIGERHPGSRQHPATMGKMDAALSGDIGSEQIEDRVDQVRALAAAFTELVPGSHQHLADYAPTRMLGPEEAVPLGEQAKRAASHLRTWQDSAHSLARVFGLGLPSTPADAQTLESVANPLAVSRVGLGWLASVSLGSDPSRRLDECLRALQLGEAAEKATRDVRERHDPSVLDQPLETWAGDLRAAREKFAPLRWLAVRKVRSQLIRTSKTPPAKDLPTVLEDVEQLLTEKAAIAAAVPVESILAEFRDGGQPIDFDDAKAAVAAAKEFGDTARRHVPDHCSGLAGRIAQIIAAGGIAPALESARKAAMVWEESVRGLADCAPVPAFDTSGADFPSICARLERLHANREALAAWSTFTTARHAAAGVGLGTVADALLTGTLGPDIAAAAVEAELLAAWTRHWMRTDPAIGDCGATRMDPMRETFRSQIARYRIGVPAAVASTAQSAANSLFTDSRTQRMRAAVNILNDLKARATIRRPIRRVMSEAAPALIAIKPLVLASPLTASTLLPPDFPTFDLVVFDEASQVPVWDAACAILRGKACVVVGDSRQLPPTRFFDRKDNVELDEGVSEDRALGDSLEPLESVLDEAIASGIPQQSLLWHYRSKDESLIEFSNRRSYGAKLKTFPAPRRADTNLGIEFRYVGGVYDRARTTTNRAEAEAIVTEIRRRFLDNNGCTANRSVGVVTFSVAQQGLVQDLLDSALDSDPILRARVEEANAAGEPLFVKNLENVQGDERATMLFSVCYGRDRDGVLRYQFGPLNLSGGERRLNVAVSRAREKVVVFSSIRSSELDPAKCQAQGVRDLRDYLAFAEHGTIPATRNETGQPSSVEASALELRLAKRLEERGFRVDIHVGRSQDYRVSLALARPSDPERWILGIELDGAFVRSAPSVSDREIVRPGVLGSLGWRTISVSAVDLLRDEDKVVERIVAAASDSRGHGPD